VRNTNRKTETGSIYSIKLEAGRGWPNCFSCKKQFKEDIVKRVALAGTELHCQQCDRGIPVLPAPRHLSKPFRCARYIVARNDWRQGIPEAYEKISPPRAFHCASCGAPLPGSISGGMVACSFCKTDNLLSDYMEFRKKAFARATSWYILFDPSLIRS
jgi:hypothetical protein